MKNLKVIAMTAVLSTLGLALVRADSPADRTLEEIALSAMDHRDAPARGH